MANLQQSAVNSVTCLPPHSETQLQPLSFKAAAATLSFLLERWILCTCTEYKAHFKSSINGDLRGLVQSEQCNARYHHHLLRSGWYLATPCRCHWAWSDPAQQDEPKSLHLVKNGPSFCQTEPTQAIYIMSYYIIHLLTKTKPLEHNELKTNW